MLMSFFSPLVPASQMFSGFFSPLKKTKKKSRDSFGHIVLEKLLDHQNS